MVRNIHPDFLYQLRFKELTLIELFTDAREFLLEIYPDCNELLYHTHALTAVFSISERLSDAFCALPIYTNHINLAFNKGTLIDDPSQLLTGTGRLIRHIPIGCPTDYRNKEVRAIVRSAVNFAIQDMEKPTKSVGDTISKIKNPGSLALYA